MQRRKIIDLNNYKCSEHGLEGKPGCKECIENLDKFATDHPAYLPGNTNDLR